MRAKSAPKITIALAGNPNVGKSTLFNAVTGLHQHTGNWPGKTVDVATGICRKGSQPYRFVDLPGTYSLNGNSQDERIAGEFITRGDYGCAVIVCDASALERSLILALQIIPKSKNTVVCVNLMDEAERQGIRIDGRKLSHLLGVPVVLTAAGRKKGIKALLAQIEESIDCPNSCEKNWENPLIAAEEIAAACVTLTPQNTNIRRKVEKLLVSRRFGVPFLGIVLLGIVWLTVWGANYPSALLQTVFDRGYILLKGWFSSAPPWLAGVIVDGMYATTGRVISVMLPPMAIFFPLFTMLEDVGYLPRMAFLMDRGMARCGGCGQQALTLCMGLGCNAVGVTGCRIIENPRIRLAAMLTNAMVPCNGRFPTLILLGSLFFPQAGAALVVAACVALGVVGAMAVSGLLCRRGKPAVFIMEMPPFRRPRLGKILVRSLLDRTLLIAGRAVTVAAPAGALLWILANFGLLQSISAWLNPFAVLMGMNGMILLAAICAFPANELMIPVLLMTISGTVSLQGTSSLGAELLLQSGITREMAVFTMVFTLFHWPCTTTLMTFYRETKSIGKTLLALLIPTVVGIALCMLGNGILRVLI